MKYHMSGTKSSNNSKAYFERIVFLIGKRDVLPYRVEKCRLLI
uniref:Uncharacterized protein n=2 Tax=Anguilla anguilla TaxID=7936 RepID=A0A0E9RY13_ANGAN